MPYPEVDDDEEMQRRALEKIIDDMDDLQAKGLDSDKKDGVTITIAVQPGVNAEEEKEEEEKEEGPEEKSSDVKMALGGLAEPSDLDMQKVHPWLRNILKKKK